MTTTIGEVKVHYIIPDDGKQREIVTKINVPAPEKKGAVDLTGEILYQGLEGFIHHNLFSRCIPDGDVCNPIYQGTYATAFAAGAVFGLYKSMTHNKEEPKILKRVENFAKANFNKKIILAAETLLLGPVLLKGAESVAGFRGGQAVTAYWAFSAGTDLSRFIYTSLKGGLHV
jgi:hypothetical protein